MATNRFIENQQSKSGAYPVLHVGVKVYLELQYLPSAAYYSGLCRREMGSLKSGTSMYVQCTAYVRSRPYLVTVISAKQLYELLFDHELPSDSGRRENSYIKIYIM